MTAGTVFYLILAKIEQQKLYCSELEKRSYIFWMREVSYEHSKAPRKSYTLDKRHKWVIIETFKHMHKQSTRALRCHKIE